MKIIESDYIIRESTGNKGLDLKLKSKIINQKNIESISILSKEDGIYNILLIEILMMNGNKYLIDYSDYLWEKLDDLIRL